MKAIDKLKNLDKALFPRKPKLIPLVKELAKRRRNEMHISQTNGKGRTATRNRILLHAFAERVLVYTTGFDREKASPYHGFEGANDEDSKIERIIDLFGGDREINKYLDKFTIEFGNWLLRRAPRTLEHSMEELLASFREYQLTAPDSEQIDN